MAVVTLLKRKIIDDSVLLVTSNSFNKLCLYLINFYFALYLGVEQYGEYSYIQNTVMALSMIGVSGLTSASTVLMAKEGVDENKVNLAIDIFSVLFVLFFVVYIVSNLVFDQDTFILVMASVVIYSVCSGILIGEGKFKYYFISLVLPSIVFLLLSTLLAPKSTGLAIDLFYIYRFLLFGFAILFIMLTLKKNISSWNYKYYLYGSGAIKNRVKSIVKFAYPISLSSLLVGPVLWYGNHFVISLPDGSKLLGIYNLAYQIYLLLVFIPGVLSTLYLRKFAVGGSGKFKQAIWTNLIIVLVLAAILQVFFSFFGDFIPQDYQKIKEVLPYFYITASFYSFTNVIGQLFISEGLTKYSLIFNFVWGVSYLVFVSLIVEPYGYVGLAICLMLAYIVQIVFQMICISKEKLFI